MKVFKYEIWKDDTTLQIPSKSQFLSVGAQGEKIVLWFMVDPSYAEQSTRFRVFCTGEDLPEDILTYVYRGTAAIREGLILHVFEAREV